MPIRLGAPFATQLATSDRAQVGMWVCSVSPIMAEIAAGSGVDWVMIDAEHSPQSLMDIQVQLQAIAAYPATAVVRAPSADPVMLKQLLDLGPQNLVIPMISTVQQAKDVVSATRYAPRGIRGVGGALARSARWGRVTDYLQNADDYVSIFVQIETVEGVENAAEIAAVDGIAGVFVGPSDLAGTMGRLGQSDNEEVQEAVLKVFKEVKAAGKPVGVNAFNPETAKRFIDQGADFILVTADVTLVARGSEQIAKSFGLDADIAPAGY